MADFLGQMMAFLKFGEDGKDAPRRRITDLTDMQIAMTRHMGGDPETAARGTMSVVREAEGDDGAKPLHRFYLDEYHCPVVTWHDQEWIVGPKGSVEPYGDGVKSAKF